MRILHSRLFQIGLLVRLSLLCFLGSHYLKELFVPFLDRAVLNFGQNPWELSPPHFFPYGSVLFFILFLPRWIAFHLLGNVALGSGALGLMLIKLPLLGFDLMMTRTLLRFAPRQPKSLLIYYWLNPVLIYITYIHGQLDIAAMTFCILSLHQLIQKRTALSAVSFGCGILCKFHIVLIAPFIAAFLWNRYFRADARREICLWGSIVAVLTVLGFLPVFWANRLGYVTAASPEAFRIFAAHFQLSGGQFFYFGVALMAGVLGRLCLSTRISEEGLFMGAGLLFGILLLVTHSMPGWYFWVFPFLAVFFTNYLLAPKSLYWVAVGLYLLHFGLGLEGTPRFGSLISDNLFTVLQTSIGGLLLAVWIFSVRNESTIAGRARPLLIGIAGDSGTGKNTLSSTISRVLGVDNTSIIEGDDYHKWDRASAQWRDYTHLNPKANHLSEMWHHTTELLSGKLVFHPHYDHGTGRFTAPRELTPKRNLVLQGLHSFYVVGMRDSMRLRVFLDPDPDVKLAWKVGRDSRERGRSALAVLHQIEAREVDAALHIQPQRKMADWIVCYRSREPVSRDIVLQGRLPRLISKHVLWNDAPIGRLVEALNQSKECDARVEIVTSDIDRISFEIVGEPSIQTIADIGNSVFPNLRRLTRARHPPEWQAGYAGAEQLIMLSLLEQRI